MNQAAVSIPLPSSPQSDSERRAAIRRKPRPRVRIECRRGTNGLGANLAEALCDLSQTGARIVARADLAEAEVVELSLQGPVQPRPVKVTAVVVWRQAGDNGRCSAGLRFRKSLAYGDMQYLV